MAETKKIRVAVTNWVIAKCVVELEVPASWDKEQIDDWLEGLGDEDPEAGNASEQFCVLTREQMEDFFEEVEEREFTRLET